MIEHVYARAAAAQGVDAVVVATDDARIEQAVKSFGGIVRMTRVQHRTGLDRIAEIAADLDCEIVINVQGDEPLIEPQAIAELIAPFERDPSVQMTTLRRRITDAHEINDRNVVKVVVDVESNAMYFSRAPIPFALEPGAGAVRESGPPKQHWLVGSQSDPTLAKAAGPHAPQFGPHVSQFGSHVPEFGSHVGAGFSRPVYKHIGLYAYQRAFVRELARLPQTPLELAESLEQLRALEHGFQIRAVETQYDSIGADTPQHLARVPRQMTVGTRV